MKKAPSFSLLDQNGTRHTLENYAGRWLILYFYPKDETKGCTDEACSFRDGRDLLEAQGFSVVGVSRDSVESHKAFADNHSLNFTLLSDETAEALKVYGVLAEDGRMQRKTFLINPEGEIYKEYPNVDPQLHVAEIFADIQKIHTT